MRICRRPGDGTGRFMRGSGRGRGLSEKNTEEQGGGWWRGCRCSKCESTDRFLARMDWVMSCVSRASPDWCFFPYHVSACLSILPFVLSRDVALRDKFALQISIFDVILHNVNISIALQDSHRSESKRLYKTVHDIDYICTVHRWLYAITQSCFLKFLP